MKKLFSLLLGLLIVLSAGAQTAKIESFTIEHNAPWNGERGIMFHLKISTSHMNNNGGGQVVVFFESPKGVDHPDTNGKYRTSEGCVCTYGDINPNYEETIFNDFKLFIPYDELHLKPGKNTYYCYASIYSKSAGKYIETSSYQSFIGTGYEAADNTATGSREKVFPKDRRLYYSSSNGDLLELWCRYDGVGDPVINANINGHFPAQMFKWTRNGKEYLVLDGYKREIKPEYRGSYIAPMEDSGYDKVGNGKTMWLRDDYSAVHIDDKMWNTRLSKDDYYLKLDKKRGYYGGGGGSSYGGSSYGGSSGGSGSSSSSSSTSVCSECGGSGRCRTCGGDGMKYNPYSGHEDRCPTCFGNGRCFMCRGTGRGF